MITPLEALQAAEEFVEDELGHRTAQTDRAVSGGAPEAERLLRVIRRAISDIEAKRCG
jgi:hypothetical protein